MTVRELKKYLRSQPDEAEVVVPGRDHSYRRVSAQEDYAVRAGFHLSEWHEDAKDRSGTRVDVVVLV